MQEHIGTYDFDSVCVGILTALTVGAALSRPRTSSHQAARRQCPPPSSRATCCQAARSPCQYAAAPARVETPTEPAHRWQADLHLSTFAQADCGDHKAPLQQDCNRSAQADCRDHKAPLSRSQGASAQDCNRPAQANCGDQKAPLRRTAAVLLRQTVEITRRLCSRTAGSMPTPVQ
jgi:hypothetical protein